MLKIGIIGFGYWGPNLVRNFTNQLEAIVVMVADGRNERLQVLKKTLLGLLNIYKFKR